MSVQFTLAPQAALDLFEIWEYIKDQASVTTADHVESAIRERIAFLAASPKAGHYRKDLTDEDVKFFAFEVDCEWQSCPPSCVDRSMARLLPWLRLRCVEVWLGPGETLR